MSEGCDLLFRRARLVDGTGAPARTANVAVREDTIVDVGELEADGAGRVVDAAGLVLAPGFVDVHSHSDRTLLVDPAAESKVRQGVTTELIGNCGNSPTPCVGVVAEEERHRLGRYGLVPSWRTMQEYLSTLERNGVGINVLALVGHGAVRKAAMGGSAMRPPDRGELAEMRRHVAEAMAAGAVGLSTGLIYPPSSYAETSEIVELSREVAAAGGVYATHMRNEGTGLLAAVEEAIRIGRESGAGVQISHHKAASRHAWGLVTESLALIDAARSEGLAVDFDQYPYRASSTNLAIMLPPWAHEAGPPAMTARLRDPAERPRVLDEVRNVRASSAGRGLEWEDILVADARGDRSLDGKTIAQIAAERRADPAETIVDILLTSECEVGAIFFSMSEEDVRTVMRHPVMMVGSDATSRVLGGRTDEGKPHPRTFGTFVRILGHYVRDDGVLSLEEAIRKMAGRPAEKLGLADRGTVTVGKRADLVLFDPATVRETATYQDPSRYPEGIRMVVVNGRVAVDGDHHTGALAGQVLRRA